MGPYRDWEMFRVKHSLDGYGQSERVDGSSIADLTATFPVAASDAQENKGTSGWYM